MICRHPRVFHAETMAARIINTLITALVLATLCPQLASADDWNQEFTNPPAATRPRCYWYWMDGVFSKPGITRDLEAMQRVGIGEAYIGIIGGQGGPDPKDGLKALSEAWWDHLAHAVREGTRLGVDIGVFNCPGWSQSGGPWVKPEASMRHLVSSEIRLTGPARLDRITAPDTPGFQRVAVLAWPSVPGDNETAITAGAKVVREKRAITWSLDNPYTVRSITVKPKGEIRADADYQTSEDGSVYRSVRKFAIDRHRLTPGVGPVPLAPVVVAVSPTTARFHRLVVGNDADLGDVDLSGAPRIDSVAEKSLAKMFQDPLPPFGFYSWPAQPEPGSPGLAIDPAGVIDLTQSVRPDGTTDWNVPAGEWVVSCVGMVPTGIRNSPAPPESTGLEVDKMNREALASHFGAFVGELHRRLKPEERKAWKHVVADSYEMGPQNWTDGFADRFRKTYGYDPLRWLPVLSGRVVGTADQSNRFLWDLRRLVADSVATEYVGGLRDLCRSSGLKMWLENYGHWGFPSEFLLYGGQCDEISGEFWESGSLGGVELRAAASAAHIYHKNQVFAEAWTGGPAFTSTPWSLKKRGDWALCQGINQFVLHVNIHQPWEDRKPGVSAWFGTEFNRHNTWFDASKSWIDYQRRCSVLLQKGLHVADVAYFIGEDAPKMTGLCEPPPPDGYDYDFINADVLIHGASAREGRLMLSHGTSYRVLVLPPSETMRPELLRKIGELAKGGVKVIGQRPLRSPSLKDYPRADAGIGALAADLWDRGLIENARDLKSVLVSVGCGPDIAGTDPEEVLHVHRRDGDRHIYFLSNQTDRALEIRPVFRVKGLRPECWNPVTGRTTGMAIYDETETGTVVPLRIEARGSVFVVFREAADASRVVELSHDEESVIVAKPDPQPSSSVGSGGFAIACWAKPEGTTSLPAEADKGISAMADPRNEIMAPAHGDSLVPGGGHAGCGLSVGTNGVVVYEHGASYFAPVLVYASKIDGWTHVAVVYRNGVPSLYLNGGSVKQGMKGPKQPVPSSFGNGFSGTLRDCRVVRRAVEDREIAGWAARRPEAAGISDRLAVGQDGKIHLKTFRSGNWSFRRADGRSGQISVEDVPAPMALSGPWTLAFPFQAEDERPIGLGSVGYWTSLDDPRAVYHSGDGIYQTSFDLSDAQLADGTGVVLDLGAVESLAEVVINGESRGVLWSEPWTVDLTSRLHAGHNDLRVRVWNTWNNRLLGKHLGVAGLPGPEPFVTTAPRFAAGAKPLPSGLAGPVILRFYRTVKR